MLKAEHAEGMEMAGTDSDLCRLREMVCSDRFLNRLPPERLLAQELGISRGRLRTSLRALEREGLLWRHVGKGTFLGQPELNAPVPPAADSSPSEVMDARLMLEPELARMAALRATGSALAEMKQCIDEMDCNEYEQFEYWDRRLHSTIARTADNPLLIAMFSFLEASRKKQAIALVTKRFASSERIAAVRVEHRRIVEAIAEHDSQTAEALMRQHIVQACRAIIGKNKTLAALEDLRFDGDQ
jgi:GntR family transcriptional repressor for pyruvate dehydrogenase complex